MALFNEEDNQHKKAIEIFKQVKKEKREIKIIMCDSNRISFFDEIQKI
jgi:hypothetical protein